MAKLKKRLPAATLNKAAKRAMSDMTPALKTVFTEIRDLLAKVDKGNILARWEIGDKVNKALGDGDKYGEQAAEKLAGALSIDVQELYHCRQFVMTYDKAEVQKILEKTTASGRSITWSHLNGLCRVPKDSLREALLAKVFSNSLTVRELMSEIQKKLGKRGNNTNGRPRIGPKSPKAALLMVSKQTQTDADIISNTMPQFDKIIDEPAEYADDSFMAELEEALSNVRTTHKAYGELTRRLEAVEAAASKSLRMRKNKAAGDKLSASATKRAAAAEVLNGKKKKKLKLKPKLKPKLKLKKKAPVEMEEAA